MAVLTIRIPDDKHKRLKTLAEYRQVSINKLIDGLSTQALAEFDSEVRFRALAARGDPARGDPARGIELLDKLDSLS
uniref:HicB family protein n=1 Tax=Candidatus Kentrum sp. FW TaxID=2126338 RepID=A0A450S1Q0_9GAMM|nr:MAG: HicB family protein [Candidatus Kentron sp. FW]